MPCLRQCPRLRTREHMLSASGHLTSQWPEQGPAQGRRVMSKKPTTRETVDISETINNLHIEKAIDALKELSAKYPNAWIELTHEYEHGESYEKLYLHYDRDKTVVELDLDDLNEKCRRLQALKSEAGAFKRNGTPYPRREELLALADELGSLAFAPQWGTLGIYEGEVVVQDMTRGVRRRNGEWIMRMRSFHFATDDPEMKKRHDALEEMQAQNDRNVLDVSWVE